MPEANYDNRLVDDTWITESGLDPSFPKHVTDAHMIMFLLDQFGQFLGDQTLDAASRIAENAGNDDAARNFRWFVFGEGRPILDYPVDKMIAELGRFEADIRHINSTSLPGVLDGEPVHVEGHYEIYVNYTGWGKWRRVGQGSPARNVDMPIYTDVGEPGISTSPESEDFIYMFLSKEPEKFTREEFDWFIAVNAFDYSIA